MRIYAYLKHLGGDPGCFNNDLYFWRRVYKNVLSVRGGGDPTKSNHRPVRYIFLTPRNLVPFGIQPMTMGFAATIYVKVNEGKFNEYKITASKLTVFRTMQKRQTYKQDFSH